MYFWIAYLKFIIGFVYLFDTSPAEPIIFLFKTKNNFKINTKILYICSKLNKRLFVVEYIILIFSILNACMTFTIVYAMVKFSKDKKKAKNDLNKEFSNFNGMGLS